MRTGTAAGNLFDRRVIHRGRSSGQWCGLSIPSQNSGDKKRSRRRESNRHFAHFPSSRFDWSNDLSAKNFGNEAGARRKSPAPFLEPRL
jgi:transposase